jgi:hypothetical protein
MYCIHPLPSGHLVVQLGTYHVLCQPADQVRSLTGGVLLVLPA